MPLEVQIALMGHPRAPFEPGPLDERFLRVPYNQRRKVRFEVDEEESLASALERAAELMGLEPDPDSWLPIFDASDSKIAFFKPGDEEGFAPRWVPRTQMHELVLADQDGRAIFGVSNLRPVRFADLIAASEAGVLDGDPLRPYLILDKGWGDAPPADWAAVQQALEVAWEALEAYGVARSGVEIIQWLRRRLGRVRAALSAHPEWMQKGYRPDQFLRLLAIRDWAPDQLAPLLGCSEEETEAVLWAMGFVLDSKGRFHHSTEKAVEMLSDVVHAASWASKSGPGWETRLRGWVIRYLESGECPPFESVRAQFDDDDDDEYRSTPGERLDALIGHLRRLRP